MKFLFSARRLAMLFASVVLMLIIIHTVLQVVRFTTGDHRLMGLLAIFSLGSDMSVPAFYSALAILFCSFLLLIIALGQVRHNGYRPFHWFVMSAIFLFLSIDEMLSIHERANLLLDPVFEDTIIAGATWVVVYGTLVSMFALFFLPFVVGLPRNTAWLFVFAGGLFVGGAIGFEVASEFRSIEQGTANVPYVVAQSIEEIMEMSGIVVFIYALASYAQRHFGEIEMRLSEGAAANRVFGSASISDYSLADSHSPEAQLPTRAASPVAEAFTDNPAYQKRRSTDRLSGSDQEINEILPGCS